MHNTNLHILYIYKFALPSVQILKIFENILLPGGTI
jgi:hypothetical protein